MLATVPLIDAVALHATRTDAAVCGIAGELAERPNTAEDVLRARGRAMGDQIAHRGPDDSGVWVDAPAGSMLTHRRLSIIDLSHQGHQPMVSASGRTVIVYNGEIYNHRELRARLESSGVGLRGRSDTEVLLESCERWGVADTVRRLVGMFAFAIWDRDRRDLTLVRDRFGIKPLYIAKLNNATLFASETRAFREHPRFRGEIDRGALSAYLRRNCVPFPYSIYRDVQQVRPGSFVVLRAGQPAREETYWDLEATIRAGREHQLDGLTDSELIAETRSVLAEAVRCRMLADVPVGAFLSGGIDSSAVVALMQSQSSRKVRTFSIGSTDPSYDESTHARRIADHLGTEHTELIVTPEEALGLVPALAGSTDEPFADSSFIPSWLVSRLARQEVTVALSGDGGDEMFAGYQRHLIAGSRLAHFLKLPRGVRRSVGRGLLAIEPRRLDALAGRTPGFRRVPRAGEQLHKAARVASVRDLDALYDDLTSHWTSRDNVVLGGVSEPPSWSLPTTGLPDPVDRFLYRDAIGYLRDDILQKVDRASMAVSLEARVPMLDHRVAEFAWQLPEHARIRNGRTKWALREVLALHVPTALTDRPKAGFGVPLGSWLRGPLRDWAEELISPKRLRDDGYFDPEPIRARWREHLNGDADWQHHLWDILSFQAWLDRATGDGPT